MNKSLRLKLGDPRFSSLLAVWLKNIRLNFFQLQHHSYGETISTQTIGSTLTYNAHTGAQCLSVRHNVSCTERTQREQNWRVPWGRGPMRSMLIVGVFLPEHIGPFSDSTSNTCLVTSRHAISIHANGSRKIAYDLLLQ